MTAKLTPNANEKSTYAVRASFTDETGAALTPTTLTWTLTDRVGSIINSRSAVTVTPASTVTVVLSGDDLSIGSSGTDRYLLLEGTFSSSLGSGLPLRETVLFEINDLKGVS